MTQVMIQPSFGNRDAWRHWEDTLDKEVDFTDDPVRATLTEQEFDALHELHPSRHARFWGATGIHDAKMDTVAEGDVVLFTGKKMVRAVGEVGVSFRNQAFGDYLWEPHEDRGSYTNIYSLRAFQPTQIPYEEIWSLPGFNAGDNFMGLRIVRDEKAATLLEGLGIETVTQRVADAVAEESLLHRLGPGSQAVGAESVNSVGTSYLINKTVLVHRAEAVLVTRYREWLDLPDSALGRLRTRHGVTDLAVPTDSGIDIVEAKRSSDHSFVRQALAQLLDYAADCDGPVAALTALFPNRPAPSSVELLQRYGIDCVFLADEGDFRRMAAPVACRRRIAEAWT